MRDALERNAPRELFNPSLWDKKLDDADDVRFTHDRMVFLYNQYEAERSRWMEERERQAILERQKKYEERYKLLKKYNYVEEEDSRVMVVPKELNEICIEGQTLHHCVASFVPTVAEGRDTIFFLRDKATPDKPYATVSILYDKSEDDWFVDQIHTAYNGDITDEDVEFCKRWAIKNKIRLSSITKHYGAKRHH